jgi:hypothetical protein
MIVSAKKIQEIIGNLDYDFTTFTMDSFIGHVEQIRGRPIHLQAFDFKDGTFGYWVPSKTDDFIAYRDGLVYLHTVHVIMHEIGHMLMGHKPTTDVFSILRVDQLLDAGLLRPKAMTRIVPISTPFDSAAEQECELFATLVQQRVRRAQQGNSSSIARLKPYSDAIGFVD